MSLKDLSKADKKYRIIQAAARLFAQRGFSGASIAGIALQAGIGKGTVYEYFASKEALFFAVFQWYVNKISTAVSANIADQGGSATQRLEVMNRAVVNLWDEIQDIFALTMEFWAASSASEMRQQFQAAFKNLYRNFRGIVSSLLQEGIDRGEFDKQIDTEAIASALVGAWDAMFLQAWFDPNFDPLDTAQKFLRVCLRGLAVE